MRKSTLAPSSLRAAPVDSWVLASTRVVARTTGTVIAARTAGSLLSHLLLLHRLCLLRFTAAGFLLFLHFYLL